MNDGEKMDISLEMGTTITACSVLAEDEKEEMGTKLNRTVSSDGRVDAGIRDPPRWWPRPNLKWVAEIKNILSTHQYSPDLEFDSKNDSKSIAGFNV